MSWNQHEWDANVHTQNAATHWANGNNVAHWDSINAANLSRQRAEFQRMDEARVAASTSQFNFGAPAPVFTGGYVGGYGPVVSGPPYRKIWWDERKAWWRSMVQDVRLVVTGKASPAQDETVGFGKRLWTATALPFSFVWNLAKTIVGTPFALLSVVWMVVSFLLGIVWFVFKLVFVIGLAAWLVLWGAQASGLWDGTISPAWEKSANEWIARIEGKPVIGSQVELPKSSGAKPASPQKGKANP